MQALCSGMNLRLPLIRTAGLLGKQDELKGIRVLFEVVAQNAVGIENPETAQFIQGKIDFAFSIGGAVDQFRAALIGSVLKVELKVIRSADILEQQYQLIQPLPVRNSWANDDQPADMVFQQFFQ